MKGLATEWEEVPENAVEPGKPTTPKQSKSRSPSQADGLIKIANGWEFFTHPTIVGLLVCRSTVTRKRSL
jgi:hypothetical protein